MSYEGFTGFLFLLFSLIAVSGFSFSYLQKGIRAHPTARLSSTCNDGGSNFVTLYRERTPLTLFRIMTGKRKKVILRERGAQLAKGSRSFDFTMRPEDDGLIHPLNGTQFVGPNGMSMRPNGMSQLEILAGMRGEVSVCEVPEGAPIPAGLVLVHEHTDHFSMQTSVPCTPRELNEKLTSFIAQYEHYPKSEWFRRYPI
jgi:hypothetical protein